MNRAPRWPELDPDPAYSAPLPARPRPVLLLGAGGIVRDAHLPAYAAAGIPVWGIVNRTRARAEALARDFGVPRVFDSVAAAVAGAPPGVVYDLALMPEQYLDTLTQLPDGSPVLIQKPLGNDLAASTAVAELCRAKGLIAAVNTQLRFAPYVGRARQLIAEGVLGEVFDMEIRVAVDTPWHLFPHVQQLPRLELNAHSVHYLDLVRSFFGTPTHVDAVSLRRPGSAVANTATQVILRYGDRPLRVVVGVNHDHVFGDRHQESFIRWQGTHGALHAQMGLLLNYPSGGPDALELALTDQPERGWQPVPFEGSWFPDAFGHAMAALQNHLCGDVATLPTSVEDVLHTMEVVEAAYRSSDAGARPSL